MKFSISFILVIICTVVLAAQQSQAKKGCNAYGHACYGGHGKRSLGFLTDTIGHKSAIEQEENVRPKNLLQLVPNEGYIMTDSDFDASYPKYRLFKIMKTWINGHPRQPSEATIELDYPVSGEVFNRDNNSFN